MKTKNAATENWQENQDQFVSGGDVDGRKNIPRKTETNPKGKVFGNKRVKKKSVSHLNSDGKRARCGCQEKLRGAGKGTEKKKVNKEGEWEPRCPRNRTHKQHRK